jgi:hypothetical protein
MVHLGAVGPQPHDVLVAGIGHRVAGEELPAAEHRVAAADREDL